MKTKRIYHEGFRAGSSVSKIEILNLIKNNIGKINMEILARSRYSDDSESMDIRIILSKT